MYSLFVNPARNTVEAFDVRNLSGNTDWMWMDVDDETAAKLTEGNLHDDHGAAFYKLVDGVVVERTEEERCEDWPVSEVEPPTEFEELQAQALYTAVMTDTLIMG